MQRLVTFCFFQFIFLSNISKAAFCKARKKLKPSAFTELSQVTSQAFYDNKEVQLWSGYRLIGVDGSTAELPNSKEIQEKFGFFKYHHDGKAICMGRTLMMYDTLNHMALNGSLDSMEESETSMLWKALPDANLKGNDLLILTDIMLRIYYFSICKKEAYSFVFA